MSAMAAMSTFRDYTYDLRQSFRAASKNELGVLGSLIQEIGYNWLDDYVAECEARSTSNAPITQLMKTPSRTATAKKTRAGTAAGQDRANKLRLINAGSPTQKASSSSNARLPLSPLGARSMNVTSPGLEVPSPKHAKTSPVKKGPKGGKGKAKKGKGKKAEVAMTSPLRPPADDVPMDEAEVPAEALKQSVMSPRSKGGLPRTIALSDALPSSFNVAEGSSSKYKDPPSEAAQKATDPAMSPIIDTHAEPVAESSTAAAPLTKPSAPARQVRSSWLSKALGAGPVPDANRDALRKSTIAPGAKLASAEYEYPSNRKSLAPVGGLKRKSEVAEEPMRPEKVTRVGEPESAPANPVAPPATSATLTRPPFDRQISRDAVSRESIFPSRPAQSAAPLPPSVAVSDAAALRPAGVEKVNSALDKFREAQHAKEQAAKAKAAAAVRPSTAAPPANTGTGFLRGLGNIGAGLGRSLGLSSAASSAKHSQELQKQLEDEEEEKRRASMEAKRELAMLLQKSPDKAMETAPPRPPKAVRTTSPAMSPPAPAALSGLAGAIDDAMDDDLEMEETQDEARVLEDLDDLQPADPDIPSLPTAKARAPVLHSPPRPPRQEMNSTTPMGTPPRAISPKAAPPIYARGEKHVRSSPSRPTKNAPPVAALPPKEKLLVKHDSDRSIAGSSQPSRSTASAKQPEFHDQMSRPPSAADYEMEDELDEDEDTARYAAPNGRGLTKSSSQQSLAMSTTSSTSMFSTAATIAGKVLGVRPQPGNVKSLQLAAVAHKKEQMAAHDRKALREAAERRKQELADKKAEADRIKAEEERRQKVADLDEKRRARAEAEKIRKENEEKKAANARAKAAREEREKEKELAAARAKAEEEAKKRKQLQGGLNKSTATTNGLKKIGPPAPLAASSSSTVAKPVQTIKLISSSTVTGTSSAAAAQAVPSKLGPSVFRTDTANTNAPAQATAPTAPRALGPPARPSAMAMSSQAQAIRNSVAVTQSSIQAGPHSTTLQQSRVALQMQLDEKVAEVQSEDIVLPDIASEYSDSDDEDRTRDFERPQWAESPDLRAALEQQATRDPDELFGPIQPLNMEELFKSRANKFRARSSSANWHKGDGLTRAEEIEYARRMGFKPSSLSQG